MTGLRECRPGGSCPECNPPPVYCQHCLEVEVEDVNEPCEECAAAIAEEQAMDEKRVAELKAKVEAAAAYKRAADVACARAEADLAAAEGREADAAYHAAYADAQEHGGHERHLAFMRLADEKNARSILDGKATIEHFADFQRAGILAALERLRAESEAAPC